MATKQLSTKSLNVQEEILEALLILMARKKLNDISISELCERAGVSRMAYYRNYDSKVEILERHLDTLFELYLTEVQSVSVTEPYDFALMFFRYFAGQKRFLRLLAKSGVQTIILERFARYLERIFRIMPGARVDESPSTYYGRAFAAGGLYMTLMAWISPGPSVDEETMAGIVAVFLRGQR